MASILFSKLNFSSVSGQEKEDMKQNRGMNIVKIMGKMVENLTQGR